MKVKVNLRKYLEDIIGCGVFVPGRVDTDDFFQSLDLPDENEFDCDLDALLEEKRQVAVLWTTHHVRDIRPDLSEDQSWEVLKTCRTGWGSCQGIDHEVIEMTAEEMFGPKPARRWHGRIDVTIEDAGGFGQNEAITRLHDMAELLARDMPDVQAKADEGSLRIIVEAQP